MHRWRVLTLVLLLAGCTSAWPQARSDPGRSGYNANETTIGVGNVAQLQNAARATILGPSEPVVGDDGTTFVSDANRDLFAYDLANCAHRSNETIDACFPKFYAFGQHPSVAGDTLVV